MGQEFIFPKHPQRKLFPCFAPQKSSVFSKLFVVQIDFEHLKVHLQSFEYFSTLFDHLFLCDIFLDVCCSFSLPQRFGAFFLLCK
jgi:hypothetical protein